MSRRPARAKPMLNMWKCEGRWSFDYYTAESVLPHVESRASLVHTLDWYACPFISLRVPNSRFARRRYVERVRPALRWFCRQYHVATPGWLADDQRYLTLGRREHSRLFGLKPLAIREFVAHR